MKTLKKVLIFSALLSLCAMALPSFAFADDCTITVNGKTYNMYGDVQIVDSLPDVTVEIVDGLADLDVQIVSSFPDSCGKVKIVESLPDIRVQIVHGLADIRVKLVDSFPGKN